MYQSGMKRTSAVAFMLVMMCCSASGQLMVVGCANGSCNPSAKGGTSISTSNNQQSTTVQQPAQDAGGNPLVDLIGVLGPLAPLVAGGGRKLIGYQVAAADTNSMRQLRQLPAGLSSGTIIAGCMGNSCNPTAAGGTAISTSQTTQNTEVKPAPEAPASDPISDIFKGIGDLFGGRKLMGEQQQEGETLSQVAAAAAAAGGMRKLQCIERNLAECRAWGPSQCGMPGVNDKCPCMCGGLSTGAPQGPPVIIVSQKTTATGCEGNSCNPNAQGGNAGR